MKNFLSKKSWLGILLLGVAMVVGLVGSTTGIKGLNVGGGSGTITPLPQLVNTKDEGVSLTSRTSSLDFVGAGVTATNVGGAVTLTIPGGGSIGSSVTGGTTGSVLFVGAGPVLAQDNARFFWNNTDKSLNIGTATSLGSNYPFQIYHTTNYGLAYGKDVISVASLGSDSTLRIVSKNGLYSGWLTQYSSTGTALVGDTNLIFAPAGAEAGRWLSNGNLGIGTSSSGYKLEVGTAGLVGKFGTDPAVIAVGDVGASKTNAFVGGYYAAGGSVSTIYFGQNAYFAGGAWNVPDAAANKTSLFLQQAGSFYFYTGLTTIGTEKMTILNSGLVGVGVTPTVKLHVLATTEQLRLAYNASNYTSFTVGSGGSLGIVPSGGTTTFTGDIAMATSGAYWYVNGTSTLNIGDGGDTINIIGGTTLTTSALSTPAIKNNGTWITGGSATTTKPQFLLEPTGTTSTGWNTSGTGLGVNAASGYVGFLGDFQLAGVSKFWINYTGAVTAAGRGTFSDVVAPSGVRTDGGGNGFYFTSRGFITAPSNGVFKFSDNADNDFGRLQLGGTTSSYPAIKRSGATVLFRLADDSAYTGIEALSVGVKTGATSKLAYAGGKIKEFYTDAGNIGTGEDDLHTYTIEAAALNTNGDTISAQYAGTILGSAVPTRQIKAYFGGTMIYDSTAATFGTNTHWNVKISCIRVSSSVVRCTTTMNTTSASSFVYTQYVEVTGLTLANTQILKLTGEAAGVGAATDDVISKLGTVYWYPVSQ